MKWSFTFSLLSFLFIFISTPLSAQFSCEYTLEMYDSFGDGWNGASLAITIGNNTENYTVNFDDNNGDFNIVPIAVTAGDTIIINYAPGFFESEVTYFLYDTEGNLVFFDGPSPQTGNVFNGTAVCPPCSPVPAASVSVDEVRAFTAEVSWLPSDPNGDYLLEYGLAGFEPGEGIVTVASGSATTLSGLLENTDYEFYITAACTNGDTSIAVGPYGFMTIWANDVGVVNIGSPGSDCGLSTAEIVTVTLQNFGAAPQSLIPFNYSVNGIPAGVPQPLDGFYTGVLGKDSLEAIEFETTFDFSEPGEYIITAWTELEADSVLSNDTLTLVINSIPLVSEFPYFENFEEWGGGWSVGDDSQNPSWAYGEPAGTLITDAAGGTGAWVTNLAGPYNNAEFSYLVSPCLDFSSFAEDPTLTFSFFFDSESCCDEAWVETSIDGGETWTKVGAAGTGTNWYNDATNNWWDGTGGFSGWVFASNILEGTAGAADVRIRYVLSTDFSVSREGIGIDNVLINIPGPDDLAVAGVENLSFDACGNPGDQFVVDIINLGTETASGFDVIYQVDDNPPVIENVGALSVMPGEILTYTFLTPFAFPEPGAYSITAWTELAGDGVVFNDTTSTVLDIVVINDIPFLTEFPYYNDFEAGSAGWVVGSTSNNPSWDFGQPAGALINAAASGNNAWVTNLEGNYNNSELSYLLSPCLDLSGFTEDPVLTFSLFFDSESCCDEAWVDISTDGGETWAKLGAAGTGVNWYNDASNNWWDGTGGFSGWVFASHVLENTAGEDNVRIRFALSTDGSVQREGMGVDNIFIHPPLAIDLAATNVANASPTACGDPLDEVTISITNLGTETATGFDVAFQINDNPPVVENVGDLSVGPGEVADYTFQTTFNSTGGGPFQITTWTQFNDEFAINDTTFVNLLLFQLLPLEEDFEGGALPAGWTSSEFNPMYGPGSHNTPDWNVADNMYSGDQSFELVTAVYGPLGEGYLVTFDYRYTDWSAGTTPTVLSPQDRLELQVSTDCGETYLTVLSIDATTHTPSASYTNVGASLEDFAGEPIQLRFQATWGAGDYWLDIDNINVTTCPASFGFAANITNESAAGAGDGSIILGGMPVAGFTFSWSDGASGAIRNGLSAGDYTVTITDALGCATVETYTVDLATAVSDIESLRELTLAPNPTDGLSLLRVAFDRTVDARIQVINLMGQTLLDDRRDRISRAEYPIDLRNQPSGLYLVRLVVEGQVHTEKLIYSR